MRNNVYTIEKVSGADGVYQYIARIDSTHKIFEGHFPERPVVPGVCTIEAIKDCLSDIYAKRVSFGSIKECKFTSVILPEEYEYIDINIAIKEKEEETSASVVAYREDKTMVKMKVTIGNDR